MPRTERKIYYGWWVVLSSAIVLFVGLGFGLYTFPVFYPALIESFGWSRGEVVTGGALLMVILGIMSPFTGMTIDRYGAKRIVMFGVVTVGAALLLFTLVNSLWQFYAACFLLGLGLCGVSHMPNQVLIANWFVQKRGLAVGLISAGVGLGGAVGPLLVTSLIDHYGWRAGFAGMGVAVWAIPLALAAWVIKSHPQEMGLLPDGATIPSQPKEMHLHHRPQWVSTTFGRAVRTGDFWILFSAIFLISAMMYTISQHLVVHLRDKGFPSTQAAGALSIILGMSSAGKLLFGLLSDRFDKRNVMLITFILLAGSSLALLMPPRLSVIYTFALIFGLGYGGIFSCMPVVTAEYFGLGALGKILGLVFLSFNLGGSLWPIAAGYLFDAVGNYDVVFALNPLMGFIAAGLLLFLSHPRSVDQSIEGEGAVEFSNVGR
ncbi:MAG: MFS transporter [Acidobacteria bacterium]|nr:MAG: MFS transporter [Acidobacteriota bacterium]